MSQPRKHHYVPVFYQRNFVNRRGLLWVYDRRLKTYKELHPRTVCCEKDFYSLKPEGGPRELRIESKCMSYVDSVGSAAIRDILSGKPSRESFENLTHYIGVQFTRLPAAAKVISTIYASSASELMRLMATDVGRMKSILNRYTKETGEIVNVSAESMVESIKRDRLKVVATEVPFLQSIFSHAQGLANIIARLDWQILVAPPQTGFIICDNPVIVVPARGSTGVGFAVPGAVKYFPLTFRHCLRLGDIGRSFESRRISKDTVRIINYNIAANSERFIMGPEKPQLASIIARSESTGEDASPRFTIETSQQDDDGALQKITFQRRRYFYANKDHAP